MPVKYKFFIRMFTATFFGWAVPHIAYRLWQLYGGGLTLSFTVSSLFLFVFGLAIVSGFGTGLVVSLSQWLALKPCIESGWRWLVGLVIVWILGDVVNNVLIIFSIKALHGWGHVQLVLFRIIGRSLTIGIPAGLIQGALLHKRTGIRAAWVVAAPLSITSAILIYTGNLTLRERFAIIDPIHASIIAGAVMALLASIPTLFIKPAVEESQNDAGASTDTAESDNPATSPDEQPAEASDNPSVPQPFPP